MIMDAHQKEAGPPRSSKPELQYIYEINYHSKCGENHRRVDPCPVSSIHANCGRRHSFVKNCNGTWKTLKALELIAAGFPETKLKLQPFTSMNHQETNQVRTSPNNRPNMEIEGKGLELFTRKSIRYKKNSSKEFTESEKKQMTCMDWNKGKCVFCQYGAKKKHRCAKMIADDKIGERICWGFHKEVEHELGML